MFSQKLISLFILFLFLVISGCSNSTGDDDSDDNEEGPPPAEMVGFWVFQSVTVNGVAANLAEVMEWVPNAVQAEIYIRADGAYSYQEVNINGGQLFGESGFVFVDGKEIDINILYDNEANEVNETSYLTYSLVGDIFLLQEIDEGVTVVFTLTRKI